jgi:heme A synthase
MTKAYRILAGLIAVLVLVQAAAVAYGAFAIDHRVDHAKDHSGNTITDASKALDGGAGYAVHSVIGQMVIPLIALLLIAVSFRAAVPDAKKWATFVLFDVIVQVALGMGAHSAAWLGWLHGPNALVLFALSSYAARQAALASAQPGAPAG